MATSITIEFVNYFGSKSYDDFNAKVLYKKNNKSYLAHVYIDWFNKKVYTCKQYQAKECKVLKGLNEALKINLNLA